jgi:exodeoxyribonuclease V gamma subunit
MRVRAWVMHLCLSALAPEDAQARTILHLAGERIVLPPLASASVARTGLARLVALYREGSCEPLPFYPRSSMAYASAFAKAMAGKKKSGVAVDPPGNADKHHAAKAMVEARKAWLGSDWNKAAQGESASLSLQIALRGETHPLDARFRAIALELLGPMTTSTPAGDA